MDKIERSDELAALRGFRNVGLAHRNDRNEPDPRIKGNTRRLVHGDERIVLKATASIVTRLKSLIGAGHCIDFVKEQRDWSRRGAEFWGSVSR